MSAASLRRAPQFATFWHGALDPIAYGCLASFPYVGAGLRVYAYRSDLEVPRGVELSDARLICPDETLVGRYRALGKVSIAMFADMFRLRMIRETGACWVDADMICLRRPDFSGETIVFGRQTEAFGKALINNAALKLPPDHPLLTALIQRAEAAVDVDQSWGAIGPFLLTDLAEREGVDHLARDYPEFYPIDADNFWRPLLPAYRADVADATEGATFLHLWSEMFLRCGYDKSAAPPNGAFLAEIFRDLGTLERFSRIYDEAALSAILSEWIAKTERRPLKDSPADVRP
jgi:hypothetical protein